MANTERPFGFHPNTQDTERESGLVIASTDPTEFMDQLREALELQRQESPTQLSEANVDQLQRLLNSLDDPEDLLKTLAPHSDSGLVRPEKETDTNKNPLGFHLPKRS